MTDDANNLTVRGLYRVGTNLSTATFLPVPLVCLRAVLRLMVWATSTSRKPITWMNTTSQATC